MSKEEKAKETIPLTVVDMVKAQLVAGGFDGLVFEGVCACLVDDLAPCGDIGGGCEAGYRTDGCSDECGMGCHFHISRQKDEGDA